MKINLPKNVKRIIGVLYDNGFEAYAVGGCVRDTLLGRNPQDWDITTSAKPEQVKALLEDGHTETIRGFKSKAGKIFNAALKFEKTEEGKVNITFDFADVEPEVLPDVTCPACGGALVKKSFGYGCANYNPEDEKSCRFAIGTIAGKTLSAANVKQLLTDGKTETLRGFKSKTGKIFDAWLILE